MSLHPCRTLVLIILCSVGHCMGACPTSLTVPSCFCDQSSDVFRYRIFCNSKSIQSVTDLVRSAHLAGNITELSFNGAPDTILRSEEFEDFTELEKITITFTEVGQLEPNVFSSLPRLLSLDLRSNAELTELSAEAFQGLTSLRELLLEGSGLQHLVSGLETFFSTITDKISLDRLGLQCDCDILWLYDFISSHSTVEDAECDGVALNSLSRTDNFSHCIDVCGEINNPCHVNANCTVLSGPVASCSCLPGYTGNGVECQPVVCECPGENMVCNASRVCVCEDGFILSVSGVYCNRMATDIVLLKEKCLGIDASNELEVAQCAENLTYVTIHSVSQSDDIIEVVSLLEFIVGLLSAEEAPPPSFTTVQHLVETSSQLLNDSNHDLWQKFDSAVEIVSVFSTMDELGNLLLAETNFTNFTTDHIALVLVRPECSEDSVPSFSGQDISSDLLGQPPAAGSSSNLLLPDSLFTEVFDNGTVECSEVGVVSLVYGGIGSLLSLDEEQLLASIGCSGNTTNSTEESEEEEVCSWYGDAGPVCPSEWRVNSVIISATVVNSSQPVSSPLTTPVVITLSHEDTSLSTPVCAFIDETQPLEGDDGWLTKSCEMDVEASTSTVTVCKCYHLTSFALLMSPSESPPENEPLNIATKVGLSLSVSCLLVTVALLYGLKLQNKVLHRMHRQLALALGLAQLVFLVGVDRSSVPSPDQLCTAWAALLHYLLLVTFLWQLCEGIHLYLYIGKVFMNVDKWEKLYYPIAWGLPLLIVGPTLGLRFCDYGSENYCWINPSRGTNWAFHAPVIAVLVVNVIILVYIITIILKLARKKQDDVCLLFTLLHASLVLVPILGVSWALGFFVVGGGVYATVVEWIFFFFTTLQGVAIFFAHCVLNREVRSSFLKAIRCRELARKQGSVGTLSRKISQASVKPSHALRRFGSFSSSSSGSLSVGGFTNPSAMKDSLACSDLHDIKEESNCGSEAPTPEIAHRSTST